jgi:hypothetical protein
MAKRVPLHGPDRIAPLRIRGRGPIHYWRKTMTAGHAAIRVDVESDAHAANPKLSFQPRKLTRSERNHREIFVYHSPRNDRVVTLAELINLALALRFEFDPNLIAYVERPRRMALTARQEIDISFWTRDRAGNERYYLAIPNAGTVGSTSGTVAVRDREQLDEAAARHHLELTYVTERDLIAAIADCATAFELLPHVWAYRRLMSRSLIRAHIDAHLANNPRTTLAQLLKVVDYPADSVRAVVAAMIHDGTLRLVDYLPGNATVTLEVRRA